MSEEMNLGELLYYAQNNNLLTKQSKDYAGCHFPYHMNCVVIGNFAMQTHSHDTGYSTTVYIMGGEKPYEMLRGTYWKRSGYDFNKFKHEHGAWDGAFKKAVESLRKSVNDHISEINRQREQKQLEKNGADAREKSEIEKLFVTG